MRTTLFVLSMLLSGCMTMPPAGTDRDAPDSTGSAGKEAQTTVRIMPTLLSSREALPMVVLMHAETGALPQPLKFHWTLGTGQEWDGPKPPVQFYSVGRYDVILTVTDGTGQVRKASMSVDAESHGCGF